MEVIEDGNIIDRIPILLQRDLEYYQKNQTVLSETICRGVVGGRLDFPRNASFAAVKIVLWLEEEFKIAFKQGSGMFVTTEDEDKVEGGVAKTSDPDKFVQLAIKSSDALLEHLHMLVQEALDHADLPVLTATLGAAALLKNSLYCYLQHVEDLGNAERYSILQACYKRYVTMSEAVGERVLDLHNRVLSLYILQDAAPSVQGWWLYMNGSRKDLWDTVPPRMAQRIFAGMLNETLTILTVRYCQSNTTQSTTPLILNDIVNILLCVSQLLPSVCTGGGELAGDGGRGRGEGGSREVRDVHAKCNELFKCFVYRGAQLHFIHQAFTNDQEPQDTQTNLPSPWYTFVNPKLFDRSYDEGLASGNHELPNKTALALELMVLMAQPQPSWSLILKVLTMRECYLASLLLGRALRDMSAGGKWGVRGRWYGEGEGEYKCDGFLCTADGYCRFKGDDDAGTELARAAGALTYVLVTTGSVRELRAALCVRGLDMCGSDWAVCLDRRQVWSDRRPTWVSAVCGAAGGALRGAAPLLARALLAGASLYQTVSLCLSYIERSVDCIPPCLLNACDVIQAALPTHVTPYGNSVLLQVLVMIAYEEIYNWSMKEAEKEKKELANGEIDASKKERAGPKQVKVVTQAVSPSEAGLCVCEAVCAADSGPWSPHAAQLSRVLERARRQQQQQPTPLYGLQDFPEFAQLKLQGDVPCCMAERASDAAVLTSSLLMTAPGRDSLRVIYEHIKLHSSWIYSELGVVGVSPNSAPLLYTMFHIGTQPFDQYLRNEWPLPWSKLVRDAKRCGGEEGARSHVLRRGDVRGPGGQTGGPGGHQSKHVAELCAALKRKRSDVL